MPNYNQTLQTNNSSLEEIITQLNNMPDAGDTVEDLDAELTTQENLISQLSTILDNKASGGGSGGGTVETCTVTLVSNAPTTGTEAVWYSDGSSTVQELSFPSFGSSASINIIKNSIMCANVAPEYSGDVDNITPTASELRMYFISGNATLKFN